MPAWTDETSYSQSLPEDERCPRVWEWREGSLEITVHRHIHYDDDTWLLSCPQLAIRDHELTEKDTKAAQVEALNIVHATARRYASAIKPTPLAHAVLLARLIEELQTGQTSRDSLPLAADEVVMLCFNALNGTFDFEAAKGRIQELRPVDVDWDAELETLAGAFPMIKRAEVVELEPGVPHAMIVSSEDHISESTLKKLEKWRDVANKKLGWNIQVLVLEGKAVRISFARQHGITLPDEGIN